MKTTIILIVSGLLMCIFLAYSAQTPELTHRSILHGQVDILIPKNFVVMTQEMVKIKYPSSRRPSLVYSNSNLSVNVAFNLTQHQVTQSLLDSYRRGMVATMKKAHPSAMWKGTGMTTIKGRKVGYCELITHAIDQKVYNLIFFTDVNNRLLMCTFNCVEKKLPVWETTAKQIMNSLTIK